MGVFDKADEEPKFEENPLPPDTFQKVTEWSTPDGLAPVEKRCKVKDCSNMTVRIPAVCDTHFYSLLDNVRGKLIIEKAKE